MRDELRTQDCQFRERTDWGIIVNIRAAIPDQMFEMLMEGNDLTLRDWFMDVSIKKCDPRASRVKMPKPAHVSELA